MQGPYQRGGFKTAARQVLRSAAAAQASRNRSFNRMQALRMSNATRVPAGLYASARTGATELKSVDWLPTTAQLPFKTAGTVTFIVGPQEGSGFYNRIGRRIRMKSLELRGMITPSAGNAAAVVQQFARLLIIYDRQTNGAAPTLADVLTDYDNAGATTSSDKSGLNMNNRDRFIVLRDRKLILPALGINGATPAAVSALQVEANNQNPGLVIHEFIKLKGLETHFKASSNPTVVGDVATGGLFAVVISSADANATAAWVIALEGRLKYFD